MSADEAVEPVSRPVSPAFVNAARRGMPRIALTVMDSIKVRDGRSIGDVTYAGLDHLISEGGREVALLKLIRARGRADGNARVRDFLPVQDLERLMQKAAEITDVDA